MLLAQIYDWGTATVKQDLCKARELHLKAARLGCLESLYNYASMCHQGHGGSIDLKAAIKWYKIADIRGQSRATTNLGGMYESGTGVPQNYERAAELFKKAADVGQGNAMYRLSSMYLKGRGVKQSYSSARELCLKSSKIQSVGQQDAIRRLASIDKGCSFCFTPLPLNHTNVNLMFSSNNFSVMSVHLPTAQTHSRLDDSKSIPNRFQIDSKILENNLESVWNQFGIEHIIGINLELIWNL